MVEAVQAIGNRANDAELRLKGSRTTETSERMSRVQLMVTHYRPRGRRTCGQVLRGWRSTSRCGELELALQQISALQLVRNAVEAASTLDTRITPRTRNDHVFAVRRLAGLLCA